MLSVIYGDRNGVYWQRLLIILSGIFMVIITGGCIIQIYRKFKQKMLTKTTQTDTSKPPAEHTPIILTSIQKKPSKDQLYQYVVVKMRDDSNSDYEVI